MTINALFSRYFILFFLCFSVALRTTESTPENRLFFAQLVTQLNIVGTQATAANKLFDQSNQEPSNNQLLEKWSKEFDKVMKAQNKVIESIKSNQSIIDYQTTEDKSTLLTLAASFGLIETTVCLVQLRANPNLTNKDNKTALEIAIAASWQCKNQEENDFAACARIIMNAYAHRAKSD